MFTANSMKGYYSPAWYEERALSIDTRITQVHPGMYDSVTEAMSDLFTVRELTMLPTRLLNYARNKIEQVLNSGELPH